MDVNQDEVLSKLNEFNTNLMIHGHTHRPAVQPIDMENKTAIRYTLGDWDTNIWWIEISEADIELKSLPIGERVKWEVDH